MHVLYYIISYRALAFAWAFAFAAATNLFAYWNSDKMVLRMYGAREATRESQPWLFDIVARMAERLLRYRVFSDAEGKMNLNVAQAGGAILLVSQFTLAADTTSGNRPGFSTAAPPEQASELCDALAEALRKGDIPVETGRFGADMQVALVNDGPVTFLLEV